MSQRKTEIGEKIRLTDFRDRSKKPSVWIAEQMVRNLENGAPPVPTIGVAEHLRSLSYQPSLEQIGHLDSIKDNAEWVAENLGASSDTFLDRTNEIAKLKDVIERFRKREIDRHRAKDTIASIFSWTNDATFWNGTPEDMEWNARMIETALFEIKNLRYAIRDELLWLQDAMYQKYVNTDAKERRSKGKNISDCLARISAKTADLASLSAMAGSLYSDRYK